MAGRKKTRERRSKQDLKLAETNTEFWDKLFLAIGVEGMSLAEFCKLEEVEYTKVNWRLKVSEDLQQRYMHARTDRANKNLERIAVLSEEVLKNPKDANAYKISYEMKKWESQVLDRATFGEKVDQTVSVDINLNATYLDQLKNLMTDKPKIISESKKECETIEHKG